MHILPGWMGQITDREGGAGEKRDSHITSDLTYTGRKTPFLFKLISTNAFELYWLPFTGATLSHTGASTV